MSEATDDWSPSSEEMKTYEAQFMARLTKFWWEDEFSREKILDRLDRAVEKKFPEPWRSMLHALRVQNRGQMPGKSSLWVLASGIVTIAAFDQEAVSRLIVEEVSYPVKMIAETASPILFCMVAKAGQIPFINYSGTTVPDLESYISLLRGLSVYAPNKNVLSHGYEVDGYWTINRKWSRVDYFKQLFLGMAYVSSDSPTTREPEQAVYPGLHDRDESFWVDVSTEAPEVTTMLDALSATPPGYRYMAVPRSWYKPVAESITRVSSAMGSFRIRKTDLLVVIRLALVLPSRARAAQIKLLASLDSEELDAMAETVIKDFGSDNAEEIDWPTWIEVVSGLYPDLFTPLEEFFELLFDKVGKQQLSENTQSSS